MSILLLLKPSMMGRNIMIKQNNDFSMILENYFTKHLSLERKFSTSTYNTYLIVI